MARNLKWFPFCNGDWMKDPDLRMCSAATRGIWIDLICAMYEGNCGRLKGTVEELARIPAVTQREMEAAIEELRATGTADVSVTRNARVTVRNKKITPIVTLVCRRLDRDRHSAQVNADRQARHREKKRNSKNNARVTPELRGHNATESESESERVSMIVVSPVLETNPPNPPFAQTAKRGLRRCAENENPEERNSRHACA